MSRNCRKREAEEEKKQTTTNSSQQLTTDDDLDVLFQNTLYAHSDDDASDEDTMGEEVNYGYAYHMTQETNKNSDEVSTAQTIEKQGQPTEQTTQAGNTTTLTFESTDETSIAHAVQDSFGDYDQNKRSTRRSVK
jgi:hypothetical protein